MRIICKNLQEFMENIHQDIEKYQLEGGKSEVVHRSAIHYTVFDNPIGKPEDTVKFEVIIQASAVLILNNDQEYLIEAAESGGIDYRDATQELEGTSKAGVLKEQLETFCRVHNLRLLPGMIDY